MIETLLRRGLRSLGLPEAAASPMARLADLLAERSRVMNLTAVSGEADTASLHFLDSAALASLFDFHGKRVCDVGSGAGFPGLPLRLVVPEMRLTLLDAQEKRVGYLRNACALLDLPDVDCVHGRAEELGKPGGAYREAFGVTVSRAVAALPMLAELCLPMTAPGGAFLAMKAVHCDEELNQARNAITVLGGTVERVAEYAIPGTDVRRRLIVVRKSAPTPEKYPRPFAKIKKKPL